MEALIKKIRYAVFCPVCKRKLMTINSYREPITAVLTEKNNDKYNGEIRCPRCKAFVGIIK